MVAVMASNALIKLRKRRAAYKLALRRYMKQTQMRIDALIAQGRDEAAARLRNELIERSKNAEWYLTELGSSIKDCEKKARQTNG